MSLQLPRQAEGVHVTVLFDLVSYCLPQQLLSCLFPDTGAVSLMSVTAATNCLLVGAQASSTVKDSGLAL